ncbi:hypothetical protein [Candidatus Nitrosacidococcus tergens]|uniref:Uncharacterized protein n=1 Tax=Candidatus Nitrosacidococcus tergens TaxID=553981 RepID=A0A7G1Q8R7_9GAMM|nr:hypothetical protein [Candidatus Nitrosacidococcus tergens]CAB1275358.1 protein of unknown function [Candidatus Nitrosacidococcus tergens]
MSIKERLIKAGRELARIEQDLDLLEQNINVGKNRNERAVHRERIEQLEIKLKEFKHQFLQLESNITCGRKKFEKEFHTHLEAIKHRHHHLEKQLGDVHLAHAESWHLGENLPIGTTIFDGIGQWVTHLFRRDRNLGHHT